MKYKVITKLDIRKLEEEIDDHLEQGWKLQGGISSCAKYGTTIEYAQAMVIEFTYNVNQR